MYKTVSIVVRCPRKLKLFRYKFLVSDVIIAFKID